LNAIAIPARTTPDPLSYPVQSVAFTVLDIWNVKRIREDTYNVYALQTQVTATFGIIGWERSLRCSSALCINQFSSNQPIGVPRDHHSAVTIMPL